MAQGDKAPISGAILVVGGGISGLTAALEAAELGCEVFLVEKEASLGGRVAQLKHYFPKLCPPTCGLEINYRRIKDNPRITVFTLTEVEQVEGGPGDYNVTVKTNPRYIDPKFTCVEQDVLDQLQIEIPNDYNLGMDSTKGLFLPYEMAYPNAYVVSPRILGTEDANRLKAALPEGVVDFEQKPVTKTLNVGAIIWATGWVPYDASNIDQLGYGRCKNVVTNMMMERMAAPNGPSRGKILKPSDDTPPESVAFVQCAGSRDENHLPYCSYICCMASLKHVSYIREQLPEAQVYIFYIDIRAPGLKYERFYKSIKEDPNTHFIKGKVAEVEEDENGRVTVTAENALTGDKIRQTVDMTVLATGMQPSTAQMRLPTEALTYTEDGFVVNDFEKGGMFAAGCANKPMDVVSSNQNATGMALKAIHSLVRR